MTTITIESKLQYEVMKREAEEAAKEVRMEFGRQNLNDFRDTLPLYGIKLLFEDAQFFFIVEGTHYIINPFDKTYTTWKPGPGGNRQSTYHYRSCESMLETIKLFLWEFKGIEVLPQIPLLPLLKKAGKSFTNKRIYA